MTDGADSDRPSLKLRVARTIKWNIIDKLLSQLLYAVTGIVLARELSEYEFGLVGAILVFQSFATLFVDSGFSYALLQRKEPTQADYSTILWFNIGVSVAIYAALYILSPWIASLYKGDPRLITLARVMFLSFIINATSIVQTNILMKRMDVKMVTVSNSCGLFAGSVVGIWMAVTGWGAWALVWQTIVLGGVKSAILWLCNSWRPSAVFSWHILRSFMRVGSGVAASAFLNVLFQNIYGFFIGRRSGMNALGYYTQADKWSKMGISSLSAVLTSSFLPVLSRYQDEPVEFAAVTAKTNRFTSYLLLPAMGMLAVMATPIFHALFGVKWDNSIVLFQLLLLRGVFTVYQSLYNNYIIALGKAGRMVWTEVLRDVAALVAIVITLPEIDITRPGDVMWGIKIFVGGQIAASAVTWLVTLIVAARISRRGWLRYIVDAIPYMAITAVAMIVMAWLSTAVENPWLLCGAQLGAGAGVYIGINALLRSRIQRDVFAYLRHRRL